MLVRGPLRGRLQEYFARTDHYKLRRETFQGGKDQNVKQKPTGIYWYALFLFVCLRLTISLRLNEEGIRRA